MPRALRRHSVDEVSRRRKSRSRKFYKVRPEVLSLEDRILLSGSTLGWTGASGTDTNWSNPANWTPVAGSDTSPQNGDVLQFSNNAVYPKTMTDDIASLSVSLEFLNDFGGATYTLNSSVPSNLLSLTDSVASALAVPATETMNFNMPVTLAGTATISVGGTVSFVGVTAAAGSSSTVQGGGTETFSGTNTFNGSFTISSGDASFSGSDVTVNPGGSLDLSGETGGSVYSMNSLTITDGTVVPAPSEIAITSASPGLTMTGGLIDNGVVVLNGATLNATSDASGPATINAVVSLNGGNATFHVTKGSSSPDLLMNSRPSNGSLTKTGDGTLQYAPTGVVYFVDSLTVSEGTLALLPGADIGALSTTISSGAMLHLDNNSSIVYLDSPVILDGGALISSGGVNYLSNNLTISAPSTFDIQPGTTLIDTTSSVLGTGPITLLGGTFQLGTNNFANTDIKVDSGTLSGQGAVGNITNVSGATGALSPGMGVGSIASITAQSLVTNDPVTFNADIGTGGSSDTMAVNGPVDVSGLVLNLNLLPGAPTANVPYTLISQQGNSPIIGEVTVNTDTVPMVVPNGGQFTLGGSTFVLYYTGGDGNDLTIESYTPVATNDTFSTPMNDGANSSNTLFGNVLTNDVVPAGFAPVVVTTTAHGQLLLDTGNGSFSYVPNTGFYGVDTFTYHLVLASQPTDIVSNEATVTIFVNNSSLAPKGLNDIFAFSQSVAPPYTGNVLTNDIPNSGNVADLTAQLVSTPQNALSFSLNPDGTFDYTPMPGFGGSDTFQYVAMETVIDPNTGNPVVEASQPTTVTLLIQPGNVPPVANDDPNYATYQNQTLSIQGPGVIANDTDPTPGPNALTAFLMSQPSHGTVVLNADGSFTYTPDTNYLSNGTPDTFTYVVSDGASISNVATVSINVKAGQAPPIGVPDTYSVPENGTLTGQNVLTNDIDLSGNMLTAQLVNGPTNASAFTFNTDGTFTYTPMTSFVGADSFSYRALDPSGTFSDVTTVSIIVNAVNSPTANADNYATLANQNLSVSAPGVLTNDTDTNPTATLTAILLTQPAHGSVTLNADGSFTYTPNHNYVGTDTFTYKASDGFVTSAATTVSINVLPAAPTAVNDSYTLNERNSNADPGTTIPAPGVLVNDTIPNNGVVALNVVNSPIHGGLTLNPDGSFTYTPFTNYFGTDSFTYFVTDGGLNSNIARVTLNIVAHFKPVANTESYSVNENTTLKLGAAGVLGNDTNIEGDKLQAVLVDGPKHGTITLNSDGSFSYTPDQNYSGPDTFTYKAVNGTLLIASDPVTDNITVNYVNVTPIANNDTYTIEQDSKLVVPAPGVLGNDVDPDGPQPLTAVLGNTTQNGTLTLNSDGSFTYLPNPQFSGVDTFTYRAFDGDKYSAVATVTINVQFENPTTVTLDSNSDTGISNTDHITRNNTPTYSGTTRPNLTVKLYVMGTGQTSLMTVGTTTADSTGHYIVSSSVLPDGVYQVFAEAFRADGTSTGLIYGGPLVIDTVAPVVVGSMISPPTGQIYVTFQDNMSGMAQPTLNNIGNYSLWKIYRSTPRAFAIAHASASPSAIPNAPQTVALDSVFGNRLPHGRYLFAALSGGIEDVAGNALNGAFYGSFPTGTGQPGSNFLAQFNNDGHHNSGALPATQFVPIVSHSYSASPTPSQGQYLPAANNGSSALPGGPLANLKRKPAARHRHR